jgi:hypothetical protein
MRSMIQPAVDMTFPVTCRHSRASSIRILRNTRLSGGKPNRQQSFETHRAPVGTSARKEYVRRRPLVNRDDELHCDWRTLYA